jgi:hypothetical protein
VPHPALNEIERHAALQCPDPEAVPNTARTCLSSGDARCHHQVLDEAPGGLAAEGPEPAARAKRDALLSPQAEESVQSRHQRRRNWDLAHNELSPLQRRERHDVCINLKALRGEREQLAEPRACPCEHLGEKAAAGVEGASCCEIPGALGLVKILPASIPAVEAVLVLKPPRYRLAQTVAGSFPSRFRCLGR